MEKEPVHELIKSLTPAEKGYFKKSLAKDDTVYSKLFDAINKQDEYKEGLIIKQFQKERFAKNFSVTKQYLWEVIMRSLRAYHAEKHIESQLDDHIQNLRLLYEKGHHDQCDKLLRKAKQIAYNYESFPHLLQLLTFEYTLNQFKLTNSDYLFEEEERALWGLTNTSAVNKTYFNLLLWLQKHEHAKSKEETEELNKLFHTEAMKIPVSELSFQSTNSYYAAHSLYSFGKGEVENAVNFKISQFENYLSNEKILLTKSKNFLLVYGNILSLLYNNKDIKRLEYYYEKLDEYAAKTQNQEQLQQEIRYAFGLCVFKIKNDWEKGVLFIKEHESDIDELVPKMSIIRLTDIQFNAAIIYYHKGELKQAIKWLNKILNNPRIHERQYIHCYSRILQLVFHYESGNVELLESLVKSTYRYLSKRNKIYDFENVMFFYLKKIIRNDEDQKNVLKHLRAELAALKSYPQKNAAMSHFDYVEWLDNILNK